MKKHNFLEIFFMLNNFQILKFQISFKGSNPLYPGTDFFLKKKSDTKYDFVAAVPDMCCVACCREERLKLKDFFTDPKNIDFSWLYKQKYANLQLVQVQKRICF